MSAHSKLARLFLSLVFVVITSGSFAAAESDSLTLYSPYTKISVPPGESIDYAIDVINSSSRVVNADISVTGIPAGWTCDLKSGGWKIGQISILPNEKKTLSLKLGVPFKVNKGTYRFKVLANGSNALTLTVIVSEQGTYKTEFATTQPNREGHAGSTFAFDANLKNLTADKQTYALMANAPRGWIVTFKSNSQQVTSVTTEPNSTQIITVEIKAPVQVEAGRYQIPVSATTSSTSANLDLEVVITGSYSMELTTPTGLLSTNITAGEEKRIELIINNTGSSEIDNIKLNFSAPVNWDVIFDPKNIDVLLSGKTARVYATVKAAKKAIPGDYVTNIEASTPEASSKVSFRISVDTPMLWGWIGVLVIIVALGSVYYLFRKYGRR